MAATSPFDNEHARMTWDAVFVAAPHIIDHLSGTKIDDAISLSECVTAFHAAASKGPFALIPEMLVAMIGRYPDGAFASRANTPFFLEEVHYLWRKCRNAEIAAIVKRQEEAKNKP